MYSFDPYIEPDALSASECERLLEIANASQWDSGTPVGLDPDSRRCLTTQLPLSYEPWLASRLIDLGKRANEIFRLRLTGLEREISVCRYLEGHHVSWHQDCNMIDDPQRKLTISILLSAPHEGAGGELQFHAERLNVPRQNVGTAVIFVSLLFHRVTAVRAGSRTSLVTWMLGPPFC